MVSHEAGANSVGDRIAVSQEFFECGRHAADYDRHHAVVLIELHGPAWRAAKLMRPLENAIEDRGEIAGGTIDDRQNRCRCRLLRACLRMLGGALVELAPKLVDRALEL